MAKANGTIVLKTSVDTTGITSGMKKAVSSVSKTMGTISIAVSAATVAITKMAVSAAADYEQLVGGVETLFKNSADKVLKYANDAFYTTGLSANEYMENVTSFSASLISAVGGDTEKAADIANAAMISISDNANKMGTDAESVTMAFQGFAKGQYMLLDNLKLGYGGTKTEMERLLKDAQAITGVKYDVNNLADVYTAVGVIQEKLGIAGTTAKEAEKTISGSASMMKASWKNLLTAIAGGGDLDTAIQNFVFSLEKYISNLMPVIQSALTGIGYAIERILPMLVEQIANGLIAAIPSLITACYQTVIAAGKGVIQGFISLFKKETPSAVEEATKSVKSISKAQNKLTDSIEETNKAQEKSLSNFDTLNVIKHKEESANAGVESLTAETPSGFSGGDLGLNKLSKKADDDLNFLMSAIGGALVAIGVILLVTGNIPLGIGFIVAGAASFGVGMSQMSGENPADSTISTISLIVGIVGGALAAIGVMLICLGSVPLGIGLIIAGVAALGASIAAIAMFDPNSITSIINLIMGVAAGALLAIGIMLVIFSGPSPLSIGLIVAGAAVLATAVALNFGAIVEALRGPIGTIMAIVGGALLVLGIILVCCGVLPLGLGLLAAGGVALAAPIAANWDAIVNKVKSICSAIGGFFSKMWDGIVWAAKQAANFFIGIVNGIIAAIEGFINFFVSAINFVIEGLNLISFEIPDWVPGVGGKTLGFNIAELNKVRLGRIPYLAQGAVIPPNREFLAVLGDQKHGTNIEAPLDTIVEAFRIAQAENQNKFEITATGSLAPLIRLLNLEIKKENNRASVF